MDDKSNNSNNDNNVNYNPVPLRIELSAQGALKLGKYVLGDSMDLMYFNMNAAPLLGGKTLHVLPSLHQNSPIYFGRNGKGRWYLLTNVPIPDKVYFQDFYLGYGNIPGNTKEEDIQETMKALAFTIIACSLGQISDYEIANGLVIVMSMRLDKHIHDMLKKMTDSNEFKKRLMNVNDPFWGKFSNEYSIIESSD